MCKILKNTLKICLAVSVVVLMACGNPSGGNPTLPATGGDPTSGDPTSGDPTSGDPTSGDPAVNTTVDLRNKTKEGNSYRSAITQDLTFTCEYDEENSWYSGESGKVTAENIPAWVKNTIAVSDCEDGVKFTFTRPAESDCSISFIDWFDVDRSDANGNKEVSRTSPLSSVYNKTAGAEANESFEIVYPLVLPGKDYLMMVQYAYVSPGYWPYRTVSLHYKVHTAHGVAAVDDLPVGFNSDDYVEIRNGKDLILKNVIPPEGNNLQRVIWVREGQENRNDADGYGTLNGCDTIPRTVTGGVTDTFTVDLLDYVSPNKAYPYMYVDVLYTYTLENYPNQTFGTKTLKTTPVENTIFSDPLKFMIIKEKVIKVSETEYKTSVENFPDLLKALNNKGTNFKLTVTDTNPDLDLGTFFNRLEWDDVKDFEFTYTLDLSETKVTEIPSWKLNTKKVTGIILPETVIKINEGAFKNTGITELTIPASVKWIAGGIVPYNEVSEGNFVYTTTINVTDKNNWYRSWNDESWAARNTAVDSEPTNMNTLEVWTKYFKVDSE